MQPRSATSPVRPYSRAAARTRRRLELFPSGGLCVRFRAGIAAGTLRPGVRLPAEIDLADIYGVARMTVRRAIADLRDKGEVVVLRGRGTYVAEG